MLTRSSRRGCECPVRWARWRHKLAAAGTVTLLMGAATSGTAVAATSTVPCRGPGGGAAGLVAALNQANSTAEPDTIDLQIGCNYVLTSAQSPDNGLPVVTSEVTINGNGATIERPNSAAPFRIFEVAIGGELTLDDVTISGGSVATSGGVTAFGGGILNGGTLTVTDSFISGNSVVGTGSSAGGCGIANDGTAVIRNTLLLDNTASSTGVEIVAAVGGAALNRIGATMTIENGVVANNTAVARGSSTLFFIAAAGGVGSNGTLTLTGTQISANRVVADGTNGQANGGGLSVAAGRATVVGNTIANNSAVATGTGSAAHGGGLENSGVTSLTATVLIGNRARGPVAQGGGIFNRHRVTLTDSVVTENAAIGTVTQGEGGGIFNDAGTVALRRTDVSANVPDDCEPAIPGC
ncbi:hypothetical protein BH18ACT4_BH18ACT4_11220 [soil metagenome]